MLIYFTSGPLLTVSVYQNEYVPINCFRNLSWLTGHKYGIVMYVPKVFNESKPGNGRFDSHQGARAKEMFKKVTKLEPCDTYQSRCGIRGGTSTNQHGNHSLTQTNESHPVDK